MYRGSGHATRRAHTVAIHTQWAGPDAGARPHEASALTRWPNIRVGCNAATVTYLDATLQCCYPATLKVVTSRCAIIIPRAPSLRLGRTHAPSPPPTSCSSAARGRAPPPSPPLAMARAGCREAAPEALTERRACGRGRPPKPTGRTGTWLF